MSKHNTHYIWVSVSAEWWLKLPSLCIIWLSHCFFCISVQFKIPYMELNSKVPHLMYSTDGQTWYDLSLDSSTLLIMGHCQYYMETDKQVIKTSLSSQHHDHDKPVIKNSLSNHYRCTLTHYLHVFEKWYNVSSKYFSNTNCCEYNII